MRVLAKLLIFLQFSFIEVSYACVWNPESEQRYWPSTTIKVCFLSQNLAAEKLQSLNFSSDLTQTHQVIKEALQELSDKTLFNFIGYSECDPQDTSPMIRVKVDRSLRGKALSIDPQSARAPHNLEVYQIPTNHRITRENEITGVLETINHIDEVKWTAQHEVLHLLGFCHDADRNSKHWRSTLASLNDHSVSDALYDHDSIMAAGKGLSQRDIQCMDELAQRTLRHNRPNIAPLNTDSDGLNSDN